MLYLKFSIQAKHNPAADANSTSQYPFIMSSDSEVLNSKNLPGRSHIFKDHLMLCLARVAGNDLCPHLKTTLFYVCVCAHMTPKYMMFNTFVQEAKKKLKVIVHHPMPVLENKPRSSAKPARALNH